MKNIPKVIYLSATDSFPIWTRERTNETDKEYFSAEDIKQRYDWIVRTADGYREMIEEFPDHEDAELWLYRMNGLKQVAKQFQNLFIKE